MMDVKRVLGRVVFWLGWPMFWLLLKRSKRTRVLLVHNNSILLVKGTLSSGKWTLPGGGIYKNEPPEIAAARELKEELGIRIDATLFKTLGAMDVNADSGLRYHAYILSTTTEKEITPTLSFELYDATWLPIESVSQKNTQKIVLKALELLSA